MKGLVLANINKHDPVARELVNQGLRYNLKSHTCWHVLGLYHRLDRNYLEAIKAYQCALRIDKDNQQIMRDMSLLQLQTRREDGQAQGYVDTRRRILLSKAGVASNWVSLAVAYHLAGNPAKCLSTLATWDTMAAVRVSCAG